MTCATSNKTVLITGASGGIGAACATELAGRGYAVALAARSKDKIDKLAAQIQSDGGTAMAVKLDVANLNDARTACHAVAEKLGPVHALVNNAGIVEPISQLADADPKQWQACLHTNLLGAWNMVAAVLPDMVKAKCGTIVNLSSGASARPMAGWGAYCVSKAGLAMLTRMINCEYGAQGVMAFGFRPGLVATAMQDTIHSFALNPIAHVTADDMIAPELPARAIAWLITQRPAQWCGDTEPDIRDPDFKQQAL